MIFGANWKTAVTGIGSAIFTMLGVLAGLSYDLGDLAVIIPPKWKEKILTVSIIAAFILKVANSIQQKTKTVTGGTVQQTVDGQPAAPGTQSLVDQTVISSVQSGDKVNPEIVRKAFSGQPKPTKEEQP